MSQEEVLSVLQSLYPTIDDRDTRTLQKHELLLFCADSSLFESLATEIVLEIQTLEKTSQQYSNQNSNSLSSQQLWSWIQNRGYSVLFYKFNQQQQTIVNGDKLNSSQLGEVLYDLLVDLQCARLMSGRSGRKELNNNNSSDRTSYQQVQGLKITRKGAAALNPQILAEVGDSIAELAATLGLELSVTNDGQSDGNVDMINKSNNTNNLDYSTVTSKFDNNTTIINPYQSYLNGMIYDLQQSVNTILDSPDTLLALMWDANASQAIASGEILLPAWDLDLDQSAMLFQVMDDFNSEYSVRRSVLSRRLDVTIQAFLRSSKCMVQTVSQDGNVTAVADPSTGTILDEIQQIIGTTHWKNYNRRVGMWHLLGATKTKLFQGATEKVSSRYTVQSALKSVLIGQVPDRGGVPEGYTLENVVKDIARANIALSQKKDGTNNTLRWGVGASGSVTAKRWTGQGMGNGLEDTIVKQDSKGGKSSDSKGGGKNDNKGGKEKGGNTNKGKGGGGGGGGYYDNKGGNNNNSGGYYDNKGSNNNNNSSGGGYYDNKGSNYYDNTNSNQSWGTNNYNSNQNWGNNSYGASGGGGGNRGGGGFGGRQQDRAISAKGGWKGKNH